MTTEILCRTALDQFKPLFYKYSSEKTADKLFTASQKTMYKLMREYPDVRKDIRMAVYPTAAVYRALQKITAKDKARKIMLAYAPVIGEKLRKILLCITGLPGVSELAWKNIEGIMRSAGSEKKGYKSIFYGKSGNTSAMDIIICPIHEEFKKMGMGEITAVICAMDLIYSTGYKGIEFRRTMSVANGEPCCDYRYTRKQVNARS